MKEANSRREKHENQEAEEFENIVATGSRDVLSERKILEPEWRTLVLPSRRIARGNNSGTREGKVETLIPDGWTAKSGLQVRVWQRVDLQYSSETICHPCARTREKLGQKQLAREALLRRSRKKRPTTTNASLIRQP